MIHDKTKEKVKNLLVLGENFCESLEETYESHPDVLFVVDAFAKKFYDLRFQIVAKKDYAVELYHDDIFSFDSVMSSWGQHLTHKFPNTTETNNDIYDVLFSVLQGVETLFDDDHFFWEEEVEEEVEHMEVGENPTDYYDDKADDTDSEEQERIYLASTSEDDEDDYLERTF